MSLLTPVFVLLFHVKMTAVKKIYHTRFAQNMLEHYIQMLYEFTLDSLEACIFIRPTFNHIIPFKMPKITEFDRHKIIILHQ